MKRYLISLVVLAALLLVGCGDSSEATPIPTEGEPGAAKIGDTVRMHYTGTLGNGTQFDSSVGFDPLQFTIGAGQMIPGFETAPIGMKVGESKTIVVPAAEAYGPYHEELVITIDRDLLEFEPEIGQGLQSQLQDGQVVMGVIIEITETTVTLDANHSLAGKDLTFEIELVEIL